MVRERSRYPSSIRTPAETSRFAILVATLFLALACRRGVEPVETPEAPSAESTADGGTLTLELTGFRSDDGSALIYLFPSEEAFPDEYGSALMTAKTSIRDGESEAVFEAVPAGTYAISVVHDENDDGELRTNFLGIPREGVGTSNDPAPRMGPPLWKDAKFDVTGDLSMKISLRYP